MTDETAHATAAGIETLIARLREEGVEEGRAEAERIVADAEARAREIVEAAERQATELREEARREAEKLRRGGEEALRVAMRDAILELTETLSERFAERMRERVAHLGRDEDTLKGLLLAVAGRARQEAGIDRTRAIEVALPRVAVGLEELRRKPEELREGSLSHFVAAEAAEMLREGVTYARAGDGAGGIRVTLADEGLVVDLTDEAVAEVILRHLQPRFRALLEGVVST
jgi:V/A-type H+-transporting ATPase subunit E